MFLVATKIFYHLQETLVKILVATRILIFPEKKSSYFRKYPQSKQKQKITVL